MHANEEYSRYDHLAPQSSKVKVGQATSEGQEIANVGMTEYTFHPHPYFQDINSSVAPGHLSRAALNKALNNFAERYSDFEIPAKLNYYKTNIR